MQGLPVPSQTLARKLAALEAVKRLLEAGELNKHLKPISHAKIDSDEEDEEKMTEKKKAHAGTSKNVIYYKNVVSTCARKIAKAK